jgi:hypothetical protein
VDSYRQRASQRRPCERFAEDAELQASGELISAELRTSS